MAEKDLADALGKAACLLVYGASAFGAGPMGLAVFLFSSVPLWMIPDETGLGFFERPESKTHKKTNSNINEAIGLINSGNSYQIIRDNKYHDLRSFVTPHSPKVQEYAVKLLDTGNPVLDYWYWICDTYRYKYEHTDYWSFPDEVLNLYERDDSPAIDCEDGAYLLSSLILANGIQAYVNIGYVYDTLHAWVTVPKAGREYILETTLTGNQARQLISTDPWMDSEYFPEYKPAYKFDELKVIKVGA